MRRAHGGGADRTAGEIVAVIEAARSRLRDGQVDAFDADVGTVVALSAGSAAQGSGGEVTEAILRLVKAALLARRNESALVLAREAAAREQRRLPDVDSNPLLAKALLACAAVEATLGRRFEAFDLVDRSLAWRGDPEHTVRGQRLRALLFERMGERGEARAAREGLIACARPGMSPEVRGMVASALVSNARALSEDPDLDGALGLLEEVARRYADVRPPGNPDVAADAAFLHAGFLRVQGRARESSEEYRAFVERYAQTDSARLSGMVAHARAHRARLLAGEQRTDEALGLIDELIAVSGRSADLPQRTAVACALLVRGELLRDMGRPEEALAAWAEIAGGETAGEEASRVGLEARLAAGQLALELGRLDEAERELSELLERYGHLEDQADRAFLADALGFRSRVHAAQGDQALMLAGLDELIDRFAGAPEVELRSRVAQAIQVRTELLARLGRHDQAAASMTMMIDRLQREDSPELIAAITRKLLQGADHLARREEAELALRAYAAVAEQGAREPALGREVAQAEIRAAGCLLKLGRDDEAEAAIARFYDLGEHAMSVIDEAAADRLDPRSGPTRELAGARVSRAIVLARLGRDDEARDVVDDVIREFAASRDPQLEDIVQQARTIRGDLDSGLGA